MKTLQLFSRIIFFIAITSNFAFSQNCPDSIITPRTINICQGDTVVFGIQPLVYLGETEIMWSNGSTDTTTTMQFSQSQYVGITISKGTDQCFDSVFVNVTALPNTITTTNNIICTPFTTNLKAMVATSHQWYRYSNPISGATGQIYTATLGGPYYCESTNQCGKFYSNIITITKYTPPTIAIALNGNSVLCTGDTVELTTNTNAASPYYQWIRNNIPITGANSATYRTGQTGNYKVEVTDNNTTCLRKSSAIKITGSTLTTSIQADPCDGGAVTIYAMSNATQANYQWLKNNIAISGANAASYAATSKGYYKAIVTDLTSGCIKNTPSYQVASLCRYGSQNLSGVVKIYPNPANDVIHIELDDEEEASSVRLINILGLEVAKYKWNQQIELDGIKNGLYIIEILDNSGRGIYRQRIEKQ